MSRISEISTQYHQSLTVCQEEYTRLYTERADATRKFYEDFFSEQVIAFHDRFSADRSRDRLVEDIAKRLGTTKLHFVAIDGTCQREIFTDFVTFFGAAYGARGTLDLSTPEHKVRYERWRLSQDVSMVAWIPIPFARLEEVTEHETFLMSADEKVNLTSVHTQIMQLAEIFLAFNVVRASRIDSPQLVLLDMSPSSVLASVRHDATRLGLIGYPYDRRELTKADVAIAMGHPYSSSLGIPTAKRMERHRILLAALNADPTTPIDISSIATRFGVNEASLRREAEKLVDDYHVLDRGATPNEFIPNKQCNAQASWSYVRELFQNICERLFVQKDTRALQYEAPDIHGVLRRRWMSPDDLNFLIGVGIRLLIEECWERNVLLYGVVKDSASRYLTRNYLGVALETDYHPALRTLEIGHLPWTDRIFCETLPLIDESLSVPWSTIEFDSAFMTLHREANPDDGSTRVAGIMGRIVNQERLFLRSLGQFFLSREKATPLMGHVVFLERLADPVWDVPASGYGPDELLIDTPELGRFSVFAWQNGTKANTGHEAMMFLLSALVKNHFAEAIGYPDPLHKADWGAKTLGRRVGDTIRSSTRMLDAHPLHRTFRDIRDARKR